MLGGSFGGYSKFLIYEVLFRRISWGDIMPIEMVIILIWLVVFPLLWCGVLFLLSLVGGWRRLASEYPAGDVAPERQTGVWFAMFGFVNYRGVLTVGCDGVAVTFRVLILFRPFHPPIAIPLAALRGTVTRGFFARMVRLERRDGSGPVIRLPLDAGEWLEGNNSVGWRIER